MFAKRKPVITETKLIAYAREFQEQMELRTGHTPSLALAQHYWQTGMKPRHAVLVHLDGRYF